MANTFTQLFYHIVFSTKERRPLISPERGEELFRYMWGINNNLDCHLYRINAVEDHVHILTHIHPTVALADYIKKVKNGSTSWINKQSVFPHWVGWQDGYAAFTHSIDEKESLTAYIKSQQEHHRKENFVDELKRLLERAGIDYDEKYLL
jgi:putative transposase